MISAKPAQLLLTPLSKGQLSHALTQDIIHLPLPWQSFIDMIMLTQPAQRKRELRRERQKKREGISGPRAWHQGAWGHSSPLNVNQAVKGTQTGRERGSLWGQQRVLANSVASELTIGRKQQKRNNCRTLLCFWREYIWNVVPKSSQRDKQKYHTIGS